MAIQHLRGPILLAAEQDQDLLGCGEADPALLDSITDTETVSGPEAADLLHEWLEEFSIEKSPWLAPAAFVEGVLRGRAMFRGDSEPATAPYRILLGLQRTSLDIPKGFNTKLYDRGIELKNREVQIIIGEVQDEIWEIRHPKRDLLQPAMDEASGMEWKQASDTAVGPWTACKVTLRRRDTGLEVACSYFMTVSGVHVEASIFSKKLTGSDLSRFEPVLASLRLK